jgi:O-antigen/teichoic acid export membrane protein
MSRRSLRSILAGVLTDSEGRSLLSPRALIRRSTALSEQLAGLVGTAVWFIVLSRTIPVADYGRLVGFYALAGSIGMLAIAGAPLSHLQHVVRSGRSAADSVRVHAVVQVALLAVATPVISLITSVSIPGMPVRAVVLLCVAELGFGAGSMLLAAGFQTAAGYLKASRLRTSFGLYKIAFVVAFWASGSPSLLRLSVFQTGAAVASMLTALVCSWVNGCIRGPRTSAATTRIPFIVAVGTTIQYGISIVFSIAQNDGDKFVLNAAGYTEAAASYGVAGKLVQMALLPSVALAASTHMWFLRDRSQGGTLSSTKRLSVVGAAYGAVAAVLMFLFAPLIVRIVAPDFADTTVMLRWLAPVVVLRSVSALPMNGLMGLGRDRLRLTLIIGNAFVAVGLYTFLVPRHSWRGAVAGTLASETLLLLSGWVALSLCTARRHRPQHAAVRRRPARRVA